MLSSGLALPPAHRTHPTPLPPRPNLRVFGGLSPASISFGLSQRTRHAESLTKTLEEYRATTQVTPWPSHRPRFCFAISGVSCLLLCLMIFFQVSTSCFYHHCCLTVASLPLPLSLRFRFSSVLPLSVSPSPTHFDSLRVISHSVCPARFCVPAWLVSVSAALWVSSLSPGVTPLSVPCLHSLLLPICV